MVKSKHGAENGIKKMIPFRIALEKCFRIIKAVHNVYSENYKILLKEI